MEKNRYCFEKYELKRHCGKFDKNQKKMAKFEWLYLS